MRYSLTLETYTVCNCLDSIQYIFRKSISAVLRLRRHQINSVPNAVPPQGLIPRLRSKYPDQVFLEPKPLS